MIRHVRMCAAAVAILAAMPAARADEKVAIDQGWSTKQKVAWYTLTQGSRLIPLVWLRALEQPGSDKPFLDRDYIASFRYLPHDSPGPGRLPIGFPIDTQPDTNLNLSGPKLRWKTGQSATEAWVGMNCAACHTNEITYRGKRMRIEGAPTLADFQGFMEVFNKALRETRDNPEKWERFAKVVLKGADNSTNRSMLKNAFAKLTAWEEKIEKANFTDLRYGYGRLDAFGHIFNKVAAVAAGDDEAAFNPSDAPVSYPFMWNIHQHNRVQWNGIAENKPLTETFDIGALGRNTGEVIGVFGDVQIKPVPQVTGYRSSANVKNLAALEQQIASLKPPAWPEAVLGRIDPDLRKKGEALFNKKGACVTCHEPLARNDLTTRIEVKLTRLPAAGTDVWMACNAYTYETKTGLLLLTFKKYFLPPPYLTETASLADMLGTTVAGVLWAKKDDILKNLQKHVQRVKFFGQHEGPRLFDPAALKAELSPPDRSGTKAKRRERCLTDDSPILAYKARPLTGIWATPPYLHNGSVPTLHDLLLPPDQRPQSFFLGSREFDPDKVGYVTAQSAENSFEFRTRDAGGRMIDGNSNAGHDYNNAALSEEDRRALVEYMKSL